MRLIDADALKYYGNHIGDEYEDRFHDFQYVDRDQIDKAPSIDIVHCQDCKHWVYNFNGCSRNPCAEPWYAEDFCSYGEREGE
jgi:hypothetical protein